MNLQIATIREIADTIARDWPKPHISAIPYLQAMQTLDTPDQTFGWDSGASIVRYFLSNARTYNKRTSRGLADPAAIKKELNARIKNKF